MINLKATAGNVLIKPLKKDMTSPSGIIMPDINKQIPQEALIIDMGLRLNDKGEVLEVSYKVGDKVIFKKWEGLEYKPDGVGGDTYLFVKHSDILAIINEGE